MGFLANLSAGAPEVVGVFTAVGDLFTTEPYIILPIVALVIVGYKLTMKVIAKIKQA